METRLERIRGINLNVPQVRTPELPDAGSRSTVMRIEYSEAHHVKILHVVERAQEISKNLVESMWVSLGAGRALDGNVGHFF
jgi:hypothetical protein